MNNKQGIFIVIEGTDGSGKGTQFRLLADRLEREGYEVATFDFPQYDAPSSYFVSQYLSGAYGSAQEVGPYTASLFYALDRYEAAPKIRQALDEGKIVLANRFTGSNMAHQGTKFTSAEERRGYFIWDDNLEFMMLRIPRPTISFVLRVPADMAQANIVHERDIHEIDIDHLRKAVEVYDDLTQLFPKDFVRVDCLRGNSLLPIDIIQDIIWQKVRPLLPEPTTPQPAPAAAGDEGVLAVPHEAAAPETPQAPPPAPEPDGPYRPVLEAFARTAGQNQALLQRLIGDLTAGELPQLMQLHLELRGASQLLAAKLSAVRHGVYFAHTAVPDERYYTPPYLTGELRATYTRHMDHLLALHDTVQAKLVEAHRPADEAEAAAHAVLPLAATVQGSVFASASALEVVIIELLSDDHPEVRAAGEHLLAQARQAAPAFFASTDAPEQGGAVTAYRAATLSATAALAKRHLTGTYSSETEPLRLVHVWPRNETDLVPDMLYEHSDLPLIQIRDQIAAWPFNRKLEVFDAYIGERLTRAELPGRALEHAHYSWDAVCDFTAFSELVSRMSAENLAWQQLSPRYGYDMPKVIEDAELTGQFEEAFDTSLQLYSVLQQAGLHLEAPYATLLGHKLRCTFTHTARDAFRLHEITPAAAVSPSYRKLVGYMHSILTHVHPMLGDAMQFMNTPDDPALAQRSGERYGQFRLQQRAQAPVASPVQPAETPALPAESSPPLERHLPPPAPQ